MTRISKISLPGLILLGALLIAAAPAMANDYRNGRHHSGSGGNHRSWHHQTEHHKRHVHGPQSWAWRPHAGYSRHRAYYRHYYSGHRHGYRPRYRRYGYAVEAPWFFYPRPVVRARPYIYLYGYGY